MAPCAGRCRTHAEGSAGPAGSVAGTHTGTLATPDGDIPPTNRRAATHGIQLQRIEDGKIAEERVYFDQLEILSQLGLVPEPTTA